jgi:beta-lactamase class A
MISRRQALLGFVSLGLPPVEPSKAAEKSLVQRWLEIEKQVDGTVGAGALNFKTGELVSLHGHERFPLASVCKVPIAMNILAMVDEGKLKLNDMIDIPPQAIWPGVSDIAKQWPSIRRFKLDDLLSLMVAKSDNTAVELLWRMGGGSASMTRRFQQWRIDGIRLDRSERECGLSQAGVTRVPKWDEWTPTLLDELISGVPPERRIKAMRAFVSDPRDTATPQATAGLLARTFRGELLSPASTARLIQILESTTTGAMRLKGLLPTGAVVAHKTGTTATEQGFNAGTNDVGIIAPPGGADRFAIAVYIKGSSRRDEAREKVIAEIARATFDFWTKQ